MGGTSLKSMRIFGRGSEGQSSDGQTATRKTKGRGKAGPTRRQLLAMKPLRNPLLKWDEHEGRVILRVQHGKKGNWKTRLAHVFVPLPEERAVELDAIGTDVWLMVDGEHTIGQIAQTLAKKYKLENREAELSVQQYFKDLGRRGYIGFAEIPEIDES